MKTLQNNFTTPEQSKRLLELGVPADSADCMNFGNADIFQIPFQRPFSEHLELHIQDSLKKMYTPCWSVGRLMEICKICEPKKDYEQLHDELQYCKNYCVLIISHIIANLPVIDFSKLEE